LQRRIRNTQAVIEASLDKDELIRLLEKACEQTNLVSLRKRISVLKELALQANGTGDAYSLAALNGNALSFGRDVLASELDQIIQAGTIERTKYYLRRLRRGID
jgi:hypothetical protein